MTSTETPPEVDEEDAPRPTLARRAARSTIEWVVILGAAVLVALIARLFLVQAFYIPSASMEPELRNGDRVLVNKLSYRLHEIHRGDIVVFARPDCDPDPTIKDLIKRVIALEGETVEGRDGDVFLNGKRLREPYLPQGQTTADFGPVTIPRDHLWVMGDNRENSKDSRFLCGNGPTYIEEDEVVGRAFVRVWPIGDFTIL